MAEIGISIPNSFSSLAKTATNCIEFHIHLFTQIRIRVDGIEINATSLLITLKCFV